MDERRTKSFTIIYGIRSSFCKVYYQMETLLLLYSGSACGLIMDSRGNVRPTKEGRSMDYEFFMAEALEEAKQALAMGEFPVGCVAVYRGKILATGSRRGSAPGHRNELDHAEMLTLRRLIHMKGTIERAKVTFFTTLEPCLMCYLALIVNGVRHIVYAYEDVFGGGTGLDLTGLRPFYQQIKVKTASGILRQESLDLFKRFFSDPRNDYLSDTILAKHALGEPGNQ
jgi:tRNA(adenine34) deaminase